MTVHTKPVALIVEDEAMILMLAADVFRERGFHVLEAGDVAAAMRVFRACAAVDILFTDVNMPGDLTGIDLAETLSAATPGLRVIITSAVPILRPIGHLPATFVAKPYDLGAVCDQARSLLS